MSGFDDPGIFFSDNFGSEDQPDDGQVNRQQTKNRFREFIRQFHEGNFSYNYRYELAQSYRSSLSTYLASNNDQ